MSDKKRKASSTLEKRPRKKQHNSTDATRIEHVAGSDTLRPIIANTPGASFPRDVKFQCFQKKTTVGSQILLHSSDHPTIDYTAVEGTESSEVHLKHYVAVYDPAANKLKLTEAKRLTMRGSIRQPKAIEEEDDEDTANSTALQGTRTALTEAFGSKKSKKAVASMAENRQLGQGVEGATIAEAITANLDDEDDEDEEGTGAAATAASRSNKPLPVPNLITSNIDEVYSLSQLIQPSPCTTTLKQMPTKFWTDRLKAGQEISGLRTRFVSNRIGYIGKTHLTDPSNTTYTQQVQLLRYIEMLIQMYQFITKQKSRQKIPFAEKWQEKDIVSGTPLRIVDQVVQHIFTEKTPTDRAMTLLRATIFALTLHVLPPSGKTGGNQLVAEPTDIQLDLHMGVDDARKLYRELGCTVKAVNEKQLIEWGYTKLAKKQRKGKSEDGEGSSKANVGKVFFAVLKFPLDFPKVGGGPRKAKR